jgi:hypothetical protein
MAINNIIKSISEMRMNILINVLKRKLYEKFPSASISVVHEDGEYFFSVNNRQLYYSDYFQLFLMNLKIDILWPKKVYNIFFTLE